jgi:hypothetical protein
MAQPFPILCTVVCVPEKNVGRPFFRKLREGRATRPESRAFRSQLLKSGVYAHKSVVSEIYL